MPFSVALRQGIEGKWQPSADKAWHMPLADLGGGLPGLQPLFGRNIYQKKVIFGHFRAATPFPDRMLDKSGHERLQPPFQKFLDPHMHADESMFIIWPPILLPYPRLRQ